MRFPWLQVGSDVVMAKAGDLANLLGCSRREAIGLLVDLWAWVLTRSPDDAPPDGIIRDSRTGTGAVPMLERAVSWSGPEEMLVTALEEAGFIERLSDGLRCRGVERYAATWEKNRRRKQASTRPERNRTGTGGQSLRKTQTQTQTQTQKEETASGASAPDAGEDLPDATADAVGVRPALELLPSPPDVPEAKSEKAPRKPSKAEALYARLEEDREETCRVMEVPFIALGWAPARINKQLGALAKAGPEEAGQLEAAWEAFLDDARGATFNPPWDLGLFLVRLAEYKSKALRAAGGAS